MKISVVIPTYNREKQLLAAVNSVRNQTYANLEILVCDDGSTDNSEQAVKALNDPRIIYIKDTNKGAQHARNNGIKAATAEWVAFLDSDDRWLPLKIEKQVKLLESDVNIDVVTGYMQIASASGEITGCWDYKPKGHITHNLLNRYTYLDFITPVVRKSKLVEVGLLDEDCPSYQEWETFIRLSTVCVFDYVPEPLSVYTIDTPQSISRSMIKECRGLIHIFSRHRSLWIKYCTETEIVNHLYFIYARIKQTGFRYKLLFLWQICMLYPRFCKALVRDFLRSNPT